MRCVRRPLRSRSSITTGRSTTLGTDPDDPASAPFLSRGLSLNLSIVIPTLDEEGAIEATLAAARPARERGAEVIVCDGGSRDATRKLAAPHADRVIEAPRG